MGFFNSLLSLAEKIRANTESLRHEQLASRLWRKRSDRSGDRTDRAGQRFYAQPCRYPYTGIQPKPMKATHDWAQLEDNVTSIAGG
jgi:hypothetical protein